MKIGEICEFVYGDSLPKQNRIKGKVPVYGSNGQIDYHNKSITKGETIIVGRKGSIGEVHYSNIGCWVIDTAYYIKLLLEIDIKYLFFLLKTLNLSDLNKASAIPGLNRDDVYKIDVDLPTLDEQKRIVNIIETKLTAVEKAKKLIDEQSAYINALPSSILQKAFQGEL
jgi:type I restriction enzyme S subunit